LSELAIVDSEAFKFIEDVAELHLKNKSPYQIARELGCKVVDARAAIAQWQEIVRSDMDSRDAARDHLNDMVQRYELLMAEARSNLDNLNDLSFDEKVSAQINATLKNIAEFDKTRVDLLQKAGILDNNDLGDELAEREEREQIIISILQNDLCPDCKQVVRDKLTVLTGQVQGTVVQSEVISE